MVASKNQLRQAESLLQAGNIDAAGSSYEEILNGDSGCAEAVIGLSIIANKKGDSSRAIKLAQDAINLCPGNVACLEFLANLHIQADQQEAALKIHLDILSRDSASIRSLCIAAGIYDSYCDFETAVEFYLRALEFDPQNASALIGLGFTRQRQGLATDGGNCFRKAIKLGNKSKFAFSGLAYSLLHSGDLDGALQNFRKAEQAYLNQVNLPNRATKIKISFLIHEKEQLEYLGEKNLLPISYRGYLDNLKSIVEKYMHLRGAGNNIDITCSEEEIENIAPLFNKVVYGGNGDQIEGCVISPNLDVNEIERAYNQTVPEITYVDGLLTQEALNRLYTYCVESTIFKKAYGAGYVGSTLAEGFASPLLLQISEDLRRCFPKIFGQHRLMQAWAYKYDSQFTGIRTHADAARVNVNFWISPDEGNLNPHSGGLIVWDKEPPKDWSFRDYNKNEEKIQGFLQSSDAKEINIPYKQNRALIFNSSLFHKTDDILFRDTYKHRRINVTLLYGIGIRP